MFSIYQYKSITTFSASLPSLVNYKEYVYGIVLFDTYIKRHFICLQQFRFPSPNYFTSRTCTDRSLHTLPRAESVFPDRPSYNLRFLSEPNI